jgi:hypothetical protein
MLLIHSDKTTTKSLRLRSKKYTRQTTELRLVATPDQKSIIRMIHRQVRAVLVCAFLRLVSLPANQIPTSSDPPIENQRSDRRH